jgi:hypothetical protein
VHNKGRKKPNTWDGDNPGAAEIILADPEAHGGEHYLAVQWARLWTERHTPRIDAVAVKTGVGSIYKAGAVLTTKETS